MKKLLKVVFVFAKNAVRKPIGCFIVALKLWVIKVKNIISAPITPINPRIIKSSEKFNLSKYFELTKRKIDPNILLNEDISEIILPRNFSGIRSRIVL